MCTLEIYMGQGCQAITCVTLPCIPTDNLVLSRISPGRITVKYPRTTVKRTGVDMKYSPTNNHPMLT